MAERDLDLSEVVRPVALGDELVQQYEQDGYLVVGPVLTEQGLVRIRDACMAAWQSEKGPFDPSANWLQNALLERIHRRCPLVADYYFRGPLVDVAERLIGPNIKAATSQLTFKMRSNDRPFGWHQDNGYGELDPYNAISTLTALDDTDQTNGCLWVIPGSHRGGQVNVRDRLTEETKRAQVEVTIEADDQSAVPVPLLAGNALILHCWTLHKSEGNYSTTRDRRILFMRYADADAVEVYHDHKPRLGRLLRGATKFPEVEAFETDLG